MEIKLNEKIKTVRSENYNYDFNLETGYFARWGKTKEEDPEFSEYGPEILDIEITDICSNGCSFCYKTNTIKGSYMTFENFKIIFDKLPKTVTQIAFGIGDIDANPDLWKIMDYCRQNNVIPNITINGSRMNPSRYDKLKQYCGAVAVSLYDYDTCFDAVKQLTDRGMEQINIHCLLSEQTKEKCLQVMIESKHDPRLEKLNAIVFLWLKPKGGRNENTQIKSKDDYKMIVNYALKNKVNIGFDSCSAPMFIEVIKYDEQLKALEKFVEPCESTLFSYYINTQGIGYPCSFAENVEPYTGINVLEAKDFMEDVWCGKQSFYFRDKVIRNKDGNNCRQCQLYELGCGGK